MLFVDIVWKCDEVQSRGSGFSSFGRTVVMDELATHGSWFRVYRIVLVQWSSFM